MMFLVTPDDVNAMLIVHFNSPLCAFAYFLTFNIRHYAV